MPNPTPARAGSYVWARGLNAEAAEQEKVNEE